MFGIPHGWLRRRPLFVVATVLSIGIGVGRAVFAAVICVLLAVGVTATLYPAQRAAATDPIEALRHE
jgi:ABC-type lipoprotein release transport system permease subunit